MKAFLCLALCLFICGCDVIYSKQPIGLAPKNLSDEIDQWEGLWTHGEGYFHVFVTDASNGVIRTIGLGREENRTEIKQEATDVFLREGGPWTFASMEDEDSCTGEKRYVWGRIELLGECAVVVWTPDTDKFTALIADGTLPGTTNKKDAVLTPMNTNHFEIISSDETVLFEWDEPMIFWKVGSK